MKQFLSSLTKITVTAILLGTFLPMRGLVSHAKTTAGAPQATAQTDLAKLKINWQLAVNSHNPDEVLKYYDTKAVLLPTLSDRIRRSPAELKDYFIGFLAKGPTATYNDDAVLQMLGESHAVESGTYFFKMKDGNSVVARYTFVYEKSSAGWLIVQHHSSLVPKPL